MTDNHDYGRWVAQVIATGGRRPLVICSSSAKAGDDSAYGRSKLAGEQAMLALGECGQATVAVYRLPNVFGKWARPNYNSAVATFCHNLARGLPIKIDDSAARLDLLHVDDLIDQWLVLVASPDIASGVIEPTHVHSTTVGAVADRLRAFADMRPRGEIGAVGTGLDRALYATFISCLPETEFSYAIEPHRDERGSFIEFLKTPASGQLSYFTALPGVTRGGHYHHSKVEKLLVVHGTAQFRFRHILTGATHALETSADSPIVVESIPGWTHNVTNIGDGTMVAIVWANELFDPDRPDTVASPI
jgi:UDP-2-acetamido-2,6-beta-L-arabino-hexul-4-ose reductase